jgi:hypothetical protein
MRSISPKVLETSRRQFGISHGVLDVLVAEIGLKRPIYVGSWLRSPSELWAEKIRDVHGQLDVALEDVLGRQRTLPRGRPRQDAAPASSVVALEVIECIKEAQANVIATLSASLKNPSNAAVARLETARRREADLFRQLGHRLPEELASKSGCGKARTRPLRCKPQTSQSVMEMTDDHRDPDDTV